MIVDLPADCWPVASLILSACRDPGVRPGNNFSRSCVCWQLVKVCQESSFSQQRGPFLQEISLWSLHRCYRSLRAACFIFIFTLCHDPSYREKQVTPFNFPHQDIFQNSHWILKVVKRSSGDHVVVVAWYRPQTSGVVVRWRRTGWRKAFISEGGDYSSILRHLCRHHPTLHPHPHPHLHTDQDLIVGARLSLLSGGLSTHS